MTMNIHITSMLLDDDDDHHDQDDDDGLIFVGECYHHDQSRHDCSSTDKEQINCTFCYNPANESIELKSFSYNSIHFTDLSVCSLIFYDIRSFMSSQLLIENNRSNDS